MDFKQVGGTKRKVGEARAASPGRDSDGRIGARGKGKGLMPGLLALVASLSVSAVAQTCPEPKAADFKVNTLVSSGLKNPVHLAVAPDGRVFIADMNTGEIRLYKPGSTTTTVAGTVPTRFDNEDGLLGISLHPKFAENGFLFAIFTTRDLTNRAHVVMRYKVTGDAVDIASGVQLLNIPRVAGGRYHAAGGMAWDKDGNLIISTGDDTNPSGPPNDGFAAIYDKDPGRDAQKSASNSNDLRGKILRIHPVDEPVDGKHYTIPAGNLFPPGTEKTRPEIYAMGARNPYRVSTHPVTGWVFFGEVGPDAGSTVSGRGRQGHDELNVVTSAGNYGWPYCNGNNFAYNSMDYSGGTPGVSGAPFDCSKPVNNSPNNTGIKELPPSRAPIIWYAGSNSTDWKEMGQGSETAMAGPVYSYDRNNASTAKFPPQYHGRLMFWDWTRQVIKLISLDDKGAYKSLVDFPVAGSVLGSIISAEYGKDGSLYVLRYSKNGYSDDGSTGGLFRIEHTGAIIPSCEPPGNRVGGPAFAAKAGLAGGVAGITIFEMPAEARGMEFYDMDGRHVWSESRDGRVGVLRFTLPSGVAKGLVRARVF
jgi:glucose/arabinose dehydrogenase